MRRRLTRAAARRRAIWETIDAGGLEMKVYRQGSNLYAVHEPAPYADQILRRRKSSPANKPRRSSA
jgi:hypothetical protein